MYSPPTLQLLAALQTRAAQERGDHERLVSSLRRLERMRSRENRAIRTGSGVRRLRRAGEAA